VRLPAGVGGPSTVIMRLDITVVLRIVPIVISLLLRLQVKLAPSTAAGAAVSVSVCHSLINIIRMMIIILDHDRARVP